MPDSKDADKQSPWSSLVRSLPGTALAGRMRERGLGARRGRHPGPTAVTRLDVGDEGGGPPAQSKLPSGPRLRKALRDIEVLRSRLEHLERDIQESRHLNKRLAEVTDVVAEVLLPAQSRDDARLRTLLSEYDERL